VGLEQWLGRLIGDAPVYVRLRHDHIRLRHAGSGREIEDVPVLAVSTATPRTILGAGREAAQQAALTRSAWELLNGFDHPRLLLAERTLRHFLRQLLGSRLLPLSPVLVMHPLERLEGGIAPIEVRALQELAAGAGAREALVWTGPELTDAELCEGTFRGRPELQAGRSRWEG